MSKRIDDALYFKELIRKLKELKVSADNGEIIVPNDDEDVLAFDELEIPFEPSMFDKMTLEEKEALFIWLNRDTMPQA
jgi:hypothetical protein|tara:strand:- start:399 stop:632 length:234 start_codon:yes stop_codon:yes gene_type:complete